MDEKQATLLAVLLRFGNRWNMEWLPSFWRFPNVKTLRIDLESETSTYTGPNGDQYPCTVTGNIYIAETDIPKIVGKVRYLPKGATVRETLLRVLRENGAWIP